MKYFILTLLSCVSIGCASQGIERLYPENPTNELDQHVNAFLHRLEHPKLYAAERQANVYQYEIDYDNELTAWWDQYFENESQQYKTKINAWVNDFIVNHQQ